MAGAIYSSSDGAVYVNGYFIQYDSAAQRSVAGANLLPLLLLVALPQLVLLECVCGNYLGWLAE